MLLLALLAAMLSVPFQALPARTDGFFAHGQEPSSAEVDSLLTLRQITHEVDAFRLIGLLEKACSEKRDMQAYCSTALCLYGWYLLQCKEWSIALPVLEDALACCPEEDERLRQYINSGIGGVYLYSGHYEKAEQYLERTLDYHRRSGSKTDLLTDLFNFGTLYKHWDNKAKSLSYYAEAMEIAESDSQFALYRCLLLTYMSDLEQDGKVRLEMLEQGVEIAFQNNFAEVQTANLRALGAYYYRQTEYEKARIETDKALKNAERYGQLEEIRDCYELLGKIYASQKDYTMAYYCAGEMADALSKYQKMADDRLFSHQQYAVALQKWCAGAMEQPTVVRERWWLWLAVVGVVVVVLSAVVWAIVRSGRTASVDTNTEENVNMAVGPDAKGTTHEENLKDNQELMETMAYLMMFHSNHNRLLDKIRQMIRHCYRDKAGDQSVQLKKISNFISQNMLQPRENAFAERIDKMNADFVTRLEALYPGMSDGEKRLAVYLRMNLSSRDIAILTGTLLSSVNMSRYRLRKTLRLSPEDDLTTFLRKI